jgi:hypothetical protein
MPSANEAVLRKNLGKRRLVEAATTQRMGAPGSGEGRDVLLLVLSLSFPAGGTRIMRHDDSDLADARILLKLLECSFLSGRHICAQRILHAFIRLGLETDSSL